MYYSFLLIFLLIISTIIGILTLFPASTYIVLVIPFLIQIVMMMITLTQVPNVTGSERDIEELVSLGETLRRALLLGIILTGLSLAYFNWGTLPSIISLAAAILIAGYYVSRDMLKRIRIRRIKQQGYHFSDTEWRIEIDQSGEENKLHLVWGEQRAPIDESEIPILLTFEERYHRGKKPDLSRILKRIHHLRAGFKIDEWTIKPSGQPGIYTMYRENLADIVVISKRDAFWLVQSTLNRPEDLIKRIHQIDSRLTAYREITRNLKNVTYAGNYAVISTNNGEIFVDLHEGKVYKDEEWYGGTTGFVCIVPSQRYLMDGWSPVIRYGRFAGGEYSLDWSDAILLSKIFNISRETPSITDLLK